MMSVDPHKSDSFLVADTSALMHSLPSVRGVIESNAPYVVYIPYIVITELDKGKIAAPVNQMLCRHMKQKSPRLLAQKMEGHQNISIARGVTPKNDDFILGAALRLKEDNLDRDVIMLTNDNNLSAKCCANGLTTWSTLDLMFNIPEVFPAIRRFIHKDIHTMCPQADKCFHFCLDLLTCALQSQLENETKQTSIGNRLILKLFDKAKERKIFSEYLCNKTAHLVKVYRRKRKSLRESHVLLFLKYVHAMLEETKKANELTSNIVAVLQAIYAGWKARTSNSELNFAHSIEGSITELHKMSSSQQKAVTDLVKKVDKKRKIKNGIEKDTSRRKPVSKQDEDMETDSDDEVDAKIHSPKRFSTRILEQKPQGSSSSQQAVSRKRQHEDSEDNQKSKNLKEEPVNMEIVDENKTTQSTNNSNLNQNLCFQTLEKVWTYLNTVTGVFAAHYEVIFDSTPTPLMQANLGQIKELTDSVSRIYEDYARLLKLGNSVSRTMKIEIAKRFNSELQKVLPTSSSLAPEELISFFENESTRTMLLNAQAQLNTFRNVLIQCRNKELQITLQRLKTTKKSKR